MSLNIKDPEAHRLAETLDEVIARRVVWLTNYQSAAYAARYAGWIARIRNSRALKISADGESGFRELFGIALAPLLD